MESRDKKIADDVILKVAKEIAIKFIEVGRINPSTFDKEFPKIYQSIKASVKQT